jgi:hypothetical protein
VRGRTEEERPRALTPKSTLPRGQRLAEAAGIPWIPRRYCTTREGATCTDGSRGTTPGTEQDRDSTGKPPSKTGTTSEESDVEEAWLCKKEQTTHNEAGHNKA